MILRKHYVVTKGRVKGVFDSYDSLMRSVGRFPGAKFKSFATRRDAEDYYLYYRKVMNTYFQPTDKDTISVDASCRGNPGIMEYRGLNTKTKEVLFHEGTFDDCTNNIGEFLAIVHALVYCKHRNIDWPIYSDSTIAMGWVMKKRTNTGLVLTERNKLVLDRFHAAEKWIKENSFPNKLYKWQTHIWGEIAADFGYKK